MFADIGNVESCGTTYILVSVKGYRTFLLFMFRAKTANGETMIALLARVLFTHYHDCSDSL